MIKIINTDLYLNLLNKFTLPILSGRGCSLLTFKYLSALYHVIGWVN
jgi:hypothetical protein